MLNKKWLSDQILSVGDNYYMKAHFYNLLYMMCTSRFIWKNLPKHIDVDFIEKELANVGELAFVKHPIYGFQILHCVGENLGMYDMPTRYLCSSMNGVITEYFNTEDIVIIKNNKLSQNSREFINIYASMLGGIQKTKEVNLNAQKTPILIQCDESQQLTMKNAYADYEGNKPVIWGTKAMDAEGLKVFKTDAPFLLDKLQTEKIETFNECLTFMGINTVPRKKERMVTDEANANNEMTDICLSMFLTPRLEAILKINEKWGKEFKDGEIKLELAEYCKKDLKPNEETIKEGEEVE
ncbi:MAG: 10, phi29 gp10 [Bacillales bacterium]|jgi:hypothetical protein|nr:10, phi29 gp10 [Bacillales bacterium]